MATAVGSTFAVQTLLQRLLAQCAVSIVSFVRSEGCESFWSLKRGTANLHAIVRACAISSERCKGGSCASECVEYA